MKITYIISEIDKAVYFEATLTGLRKRGFDISVILINSENGSLHRFLRDQRFKIVDIKCIKISKSIPAILKCRKILIQENPDIIHCHLATANWVGLWSGWLANISSRIYTRHSGEVIGESYKLKFIDKVQNWLATDIVAISGVTEELLMNQGVKSNKISLIYHGFELEKYENPEKEEIERIRISYNPDKKFPVIGVVSRWMEWKGVQHTVEAFSELLDTYPNALLCLFGKGKGADFEKEIDFLLKQKIPSKNVCVVGFEPYVYGLFSLFDIYVHVPLERTYEAFGQTYVEALAAGCPSIFSLAGIAAEFVEHEKNALVISSVNAGNIHSMMQVILNNPEIESKIVKNGILDVQQFSFDNYIKKLTELYRA